MGAHEAFVVVDFRQKPVIKHEWTREKASAPSLRPSFPHLSEGGFAHDR